MYIVISWSIRGDFLSQKLHPLGSGLLPSLVFPSIMPSSIPAIVQHRQITKYAYSLFCGEIWVIKVPTWQQSWVLKSFTRGSLVLFFNVPKSLLFVDFQPSLTSFLPRVWADIPQDVSRYLYPLGPELPFPISLMVSEQLSTTTYLSQHRPDCPFKESEQPFICF